MGLPYALPRTLGTASTLRSRMKQLRPHQRWAIVHEYARLGNVQDVAHQLHLPENTVRKWVSRFKATGSVEPLKKTGRPPILDSTARVAALNMLLGPDARGAEDVSMALLEEGFTSSKPSRNTVIRAAKATAKSDGKPIHCVRGLPRKGFTDKTKAQRLDFARRNQKRAWAHVMFTDRKRFEFKYPGVKVSKCKWVIKGQRHEAYMPNHPDGVNVYAGFTVYGMTRAHIVTGSSKHHSQYKNKQGKPARNITTAEYEDVMFNTLLPEGKRIFTAAGIASWTFQQDNDPAHKAGSHHLDTWNEQHGSSISAMAWPPNSPDLSPIENVWALVDAKVQAKACKDFEEFKKAVLYELQHIPKDVLKRLGDSMPKRIRQVLKFGGGKTKY